MVRMMRTFNISSDIAYFAAFASVLLSIAMWFMRREDPRVDNAQAERFGIFIGLWAPTLAILGRAIEEHERRFENIDQ